MARTTTAVPTTLAAAKEASRERWLAHFRAMREAPETPEQATGRKAEIARMQQIARGADHEPDPMPGAIALILAMDAERADHVCLAVGAHRLVRQTVLDDVREGGGTSEELPRLLNLLSSYLDGCSWHWVGDTMTEDYDPRKIRAEVESLVAGLR